MEDKTIKKLVAQAIKHLLYQDRWLLLHDLSEPSISHKLAEHLQLLFKEYNVDCEYNSNIARDDGIKRISILKDELRRAGLLKEKEEEELEKEFTERAILPDIIIHRRGSNADNLCIIEVKKETSKVSSDYDYLKLRAYTSVDMKNDLRYQMGIFIHFYIGEGFKYPLIMTFKMGEQEP